MVKEKRKKVLKEPLIVGILFGMILMYGLVAYLPDNINLTKWVAYRNIENIFKIFCATVVGSIIGVERETKNRPAGLKTHALVAIGSTIVMLIPLELMDYNGFSTVDPTRLGAQVISGIGFLGAGTIIRNGATVKGLTTAASLWVVAIIGLAIGGGLYVISFCAAIVVIVILRILGNLQGRHELNNVHSELLVHIIDNPGQIGAIGHVLGKYGIKIRSLDIIEEEDEADGSGAILVSLYVKKPFDLDQSAFLRELKKTDGVISIALGG